MSHWLFFRFKTSLQVLQLFRTADLLVLLMVFRAACFGHEPLGELLQVPGILRLDLRLLPEEVLQVLEQLDSHLGLLLQTSLLLHQLGPHIYTNTHTHTQNGCTL